MLWVTKLCGDGGWYVRAWQTEFGDPQIAPKHLARAVSNEKRSRNDDEKGRPGGAASLRSNGGSRIAAEDVELLAREAQLPAATLQQRPAHVRPPVRLA